MISILLFGIFVGVYAAFAVHGIVPGDAGDLVTASATFGVPHPPGYPLYTFLGWLLTRMPVATPAFLVTVLSFIPHALTVSVIYLFVFRLTKNRFSALFSSLTLAGNYVFFHYSITPEVFALLDFFSAVILYFAVIMHQKKKTPMMYWYLLAFLFGLALSHHPFIVLLIPSVVLLLYKKRTDVFRKPMHILRVVSLIILGFLPYVYSAIAARGDAVVNWDRVTTLHRMFRLMTRADYGSFMSGGTVGHSLLERMLNVRIYLGFVAIDFTYIGIVLACIGFVWLWRRHRLVSMSLALGWFFAGPVFSFYASFQTINRFVLATVERFVLPSYLLFSISIGIGIIPASRGIAYVISRFVHRRHALLVCLSGLVLFVYPVSMGIANAWKFFGLSGDYSTNNYAQDLLRNTPKSAIVLLTRDTPLFASQYMRYVLGYRADTMLLHSNRLQSADYLEVIAGAFPKIVLPEKHIDAAGNLSKIIGQNAGHYPIISNVAYPDIDAWEWVPHGLLYVLTSQNDVPPPETVFETNRALWNAFRDPESGTLSRYTHLFLSNVSDEYAIAANQIGKYLLTKNAYNEAAFFYRKAITYNSDTQAPIAWMYFGLSQSLLGFCDEALAAYAKAGEYPPFGSNAALLFYEAETYRTCVGDAVQAQKLYEQYRELVAESEVPLELSRPDTLPR